LNNLDAPTKKALIKKAQQGHETQQKVELQ